jgi:hypothetical protein
VDHGCSKKNILILFFFFLFFFFSSLKFTLLGRNTCG